jgi:putative ABC transport system substrate-binding protein
MRRREFITAIAGSAAAWPLVARAQQSDHMRRIGGLMNFPSNDPEGQARTVAFKQTLSKLGWIEGGNLHTEIRWAADDPDLYRRYAEELVALTPDVIFASGSQSVEALQRATRSTPIVFANVIDPVGAGFIHSLPRPGGNSTGFTAFEYSISGKWLELLKELTPSVIRVAVLRDPSFAAGIGLLGGPRRGRSSSTTGCGGSVFSWLWLQTIPPDRPAS